MAAEDRSVYRIQVQISAVPNSADDDTEIYYKVYTPAYSVTFTI